MNRAFRYLSFRRLGGLPVVGAAAIGLVVTPVAADSPSVFVAAPPPPSPAAMALSIGSAPSVNCSVVGDQPLLACSTHSEFVWPNAGTQPTNLAGKVAQNAVRQGTVGGTPSVAISTGGFLSNLPSIAYAFGGLIVVAGGVSLASGGHNPVSP